MSGRHFRVEIQREEPAYDPLDEITASEIIRFANALNKAPSSLMRDLQQARQERALVGRYRAF